MRMVSTLYTFQILVVVSMVWRPSHAVIQLSCGSNINLNPSSVATYRFGDYTNPYPTGLSCDFDFSLSDANEKILFQVFPQCTPGADVLKINNGPNACCDGCEQPISAPSNAFQVSLTTDSTSGPKELGFVIRIATGKDESRCPTSSPSPIIVSVGSSPVTITSPGFPNKYPTFSDCRYTISPHDSSKGLSLTFDVISLDYYNGCYDKIQLGLYNTDPVDICTNYKMSLFLPNERYTSGGETHLNFTSDDRDEGYGFRVTIVQVDLGATQSPTTETTAASAHVGTTTETIVKSTPTSVPATVQSVSSTITASSAESTAVVSTAAPHTDPSTVIQLSCGENINLNPSSVATYRFGDYTNPYPTGLSCNFDFSLSDANEKILFQVFPKCTQDADVLKINDGPNVCCPGCEVPITAPSNAFQVSFTTDSTSGPEELGFVIRIATGKDESNCATSSPSPIIVSVGSSPVTITSPGFPNKYPTSSDCRYTISPHDSSKGLSLTFDVISLDYFNGCYDKIQLGLYDTDPVDICTNYKMSLFLPNERYTSGGETHLNFTSDDRDEGYGFRVTIVQVDLGATQPPTAASTTAAQTTETTSASTTSAQTTETILESTTAAQTTETTSASTTSAQTTETILESTTAAQTTKTTAASATVGTTADTTVKSTTSQTTAVPATVQSVSSTITASTAESTAAVSTEAPHTNPTTETIESNETTKESTTTTSSTSMTTVTKTEVTVSSTELPPTTSFPETTTTGFFDALTTSAKVVAVTGLVFLGVVPLIVMAIFCLIRKRKKPSRDNRLHNPNLHNAKYYNTYHYQMTHKPLFYQYWGEL
ncbi:mucin-5AC-like isoform X2 [Crassostrea angulata]|uniref:mucin-5AC-like isoform X2 n=1 Tax=Magallana angulata TaxID=2784310 RepID=UPI0022B2083C|nr:mucin-5AC-like isoform X2 [Crassostrea angulata]